MTAPRPLMALSADTFDVEERTDTQDFADRLCRYAAANGMTIQQVAQVVAIFREVVTP